MGTLTLPSSGLVYVDTSVFIYSIEKIPDYATLLAPLWTAAATGTIEIISSELSLMEALVAPYRKNDAALASDYEQVFQQGGVQAISITRSILREGAHLRARVTSLRTPDAIHAATSGLTGCTLFLTNDVGFRQVPGLPVVVLKDLL